MWLHKKFQGPAYFICRSAFTFIVTYPWGVKHPIHLLIGFFIWSSTTTTIRFKCFIHFPWRSLLWFYEASIDVPTCFCQQNFKNLMSFTVQNKQHKQKHDGQYTLAWNSSRSKHELFCHFLEGKKRTLLASSVYEASFSRQVAFQWPRIQATAWQ